MVSEMSQTKKGKYCIILLIELYRIDKFIDRMWNSSNWGGGWLGQGEWGVLIYCIESFCL